MCFSKSRAAKEEFPESEFLQVSTQSFTLFFLRNLRRSFGRPPGREPMAFWKSFFEGWTVFFLVHLFYFGVEV